MSERVMDPLVFSPFLRPVVWGGRQLGEVLHKVLPMDAAYGESWEISPHAVHVSRVAEGPHAGRTLNELCSEHSSELFGRGTAATPFPMLIKFLDCRELLSIQVHPDDRLAREVADESLGKSEAWVVLAAEPGARIYAGFRAGVTRREVEQHLAAGTLADLLHVISPRSGDCLFLPAGTVHAVGGGVLMAEIQQASDATFRLFDWNRTGADGRPRELHVEQALAAIDWQAGPVRCVTPRLLEHAAADVRCERLVDCNHFRIERIHMTAPYTIASRSGAEVWIVIAGSAELQTASGYRRTFRCGETVLIPATARDPQWSPADSSATLLRVAVPY